MKIIKPNAVIMEHNLPHYAFIERVGRTCYKSEDKITEKSAVKFVKDLVQRQHMAMLEHEHLYFSFSPMFMKEFLADISWCMYAKESHTNPLKYFNVTHERGIHILSGSFRSFYDLFNSGVKGNSIMFLKYTLQEYFPVVFGYPISEYTYDGLDLDCELLSRQVFIERFEDSCPEVLYKHLVHTVLFTCDRGVSHEFVRHRPASFAQESTRYCCYVKEKFGNELTVIEPCFWKGENSAYPYEVWKEQCESAEKGYIMLTEMGASPQEARSVLPSSLKTELIITTTESEWQHIVNLRHKGTTGAPHPQIREVMSLIVGSLREESNNRIS